MSHAKTSTRIPSGHRTVVCIGSGKRPFRVHKKSNLGRCDRCDEIVGTRNGNLKRHYTRMAVADLPLISGGATDLDNPPESPSLTYDELTEAWRAASRRIMQRHARLSPLQKRRGRGKRTQQVRHDFLRLTMEHRIRVTELFPRSWERRMRAITELSERDRRVELLIGSPVLIGMKAPSGGQDLPRPRLDTLPEGSNYRDDGCHVAPSCLNCPRELCIYDDPAELAKTSQAYRDDRIFTLRKCGVPVQDIAKAVGRSTRTVHRVIRQGGANKVDRAEIAEHLRGIQALRQHQERRIYKQPQPLPAIAGNYRTGGQY